MAGPRIWRHPRPEGAAGRCIGLTDLLLDRRRAKRLAHRIRRAQRREGGLREVWTSPLQRCANVGRWLRRWGWRHRIDAGLSELDFGRWDGLPWAAIGAEAVQAWCDDFEAHAPGGGESVAQLLARCRTWCEAMADRPAVVVAHAGWINAWRVLHGTARGRALMASDWPAALPYGARLIADQAAATRKVLGAESQ